MGIELWFCLTAVLHYGPRYAVRKIDANYRILKEKGRTNVGRPLILTFFKVTVGRIFLLPTAWEVVGELHRCRFFPTHWSCCQDCTDALLPCRYWATL